MEGFVPGEQGAALNETDALLGLGAWLGAVLGRLRCGEAPVPPDADEADVEELAYSFGARLAMGVPAWAYKRVPRIPALDALLAEIHQRSRNQPWEGSLWYGGILLFCPTPLPLAIAHDFIDRGIAHTFLSHSHQEEEVWWRLVEDPDPEAVYLIAYYRYERPEDNWHRVEEVLHQFPWDDLLHKLARATPSSREKAVGLAERILTHPKEEHEHILGSRRKLDPEFAAVWEEVSKRA